MEIIRLFRRILPTIIVLGLVLSMFARVNPIYAAPSVFDWDTNTWPAGSLSRSYTGIGTPSTDFTFTISGDTSQFETGSPATNQTITGGITPAQKSLFFAADYTSNSQSITLSIDLSREATDVSFLVMDIDQPIPDGIDKIVVTGIDNLGSTVLPTLIAADPTCVSVVGNTATGLCAVDNSTYNGNVTVSFATGIERIIIEHQEGYSGANPGSHGVAVADINFDPGEIPPTRTLTPTPTATDTSTPTPTYSSTSTSTPTPLPTSTSTPTPSPTSTSTHTPTQTQTETSTPSHTPTKTQSKTPAPSKTPTPTNNPTKTQPAKFELLRYIPLVISSN